MRSDVLHAWSEEGHVGEFRRGPSGSVTFSYDSERRVPVSLSLPLSGGHSKRAPSAFLENLLPDDPASRRRIRGARQAEMPFLSGRGQPKFTVARMHGVWLWPDATTPSTHIIKPEVIDCPDSDLVEDAVMTLGERCGLSVASHGIVRFDDTRAFVTERFDRRIEDGMVRRLHCEDLAQSMGISPEDKYMVDAASCVRLLRRCDPSGGLAYEWIRRCAFNVSSADCDSHGKNYSIMFDREGFGFTPMYDMTATRVWPRLDQELAMPINGIEYPELLTPRDWESFGRRTGLDGARVAAIARDMAYRVLNHVEETASGLPANTKDRLIAAVGKANAAIEPVDEGLASPQSPISAGYPVGMTWVGPYERNGSTVSGYWRTR